MRRRRSRCRGFTCIELAVILGVLGSLIIVLTTIVVGTVDRARAAHASAWNSPSEELCR